MAYFLFLKDIFPQPKTLFRYLDTLKKILSPDSICLFDHPLMKELKYAVKSDPSQVPTLPTKSSWDPDTVLDYMRTLQPPHEMNKIMLSGRVLILLLLVSGRRKIDLHKLDVRLQFMQRATDSYYFAMSNFAKGHKRIKRHDFKQFIEFAAYPEDQRVCPVFMIDQYLKHIRHRSPEHLPDHTQFFVRTTDGGPAHPDTLARWGATFLQAAKVIDPPTPGVMRKGVSSVRAAHASKSFLCGENLDSIMKRCAWSSASTFFRFYCKPITSNNDDAEKQRIFAKAVQKNLKVHKIEHKEFMKEKFIFSRPKQFKGTESNIPHRRTVDTDRETNIMTELAFNQQIMAGEYASNDEPPDEVSTVAASEHSDAEFEFDLCHKSPGKIPFPEPGFWDSDNPTLPSPIRSTDHSEGLISAPDAGEQNFPSIQKPMLQTLLTLPRFSSSPNDVDSAPRELSAIDISDDLVDTEVPIQISIHKPSSNDSQEEILAQASLVEVEVSLTEVSEQTTTPQDPSEQTSTLADTPDRVSAEPQKEPPVASFLSMSEQRKTNLTVPDPEQLFPNGPGILQCSIKEIVPDAPIDRQVFFGDNFNYIAAMPKTFSPQGLLGHFVVLQSSPPKLGIICSPDTVDPYGEPVAITVNDTPFRAKPVNLDQLRSAFKVLPT